MLQNKECETNSLDSEELVVGENERITRDEIVIQVKKLLHTVGEIDALAHRIPRDVKEDPIVKRGLKFFTVVGEALRGLDLFLASPLGPTAANLVFRHMNEVKQFVEIGASIVISTFFVVVGQELLEAKNEEFVAAGNSIERSIQFVKSKLDEIERRVNDAANDLQRIGQRDYTHKDLETLLWDFGENVRLAKLDIDDCEDELKDANKKIDQVLDKIQARMWLNGAFRGASVTIGVFLTYFLIKRTMINPYIGSTIGVVSTCVALSVKLPRSRKLHEDFLRYRDTQENLHRELNRMKLRLASHETTYHQLKLN